MMTFIPLVEPWVGADCAEAVRAQVQSGFLGPGQTTQRFADRLAAVSGSDHCVLTTSGTIALSVAALAIGLKPGDEILVPAYGVISTINAFASIGLKPRLVDIDPATGCIDPESLAGRLTARTSAVCFVNFSGHTGEPRSAVAAVCREKGLPLIEDAACALGHVHEGQPAGSAGSVGVLSFSVPKVVTTGQGGALLTSNKKIADRANEIIDHGDLEWRRTNITRKIGTNLRFNDVLAALGLAQVEVMPARLERRRRSYRMMRDLLDGHMYEVPGGEAPLHNIVFTDDQTALMASLRTAEIAAVAPYRFLPEHPPYADLDDGDFTGAQLWARTAVLLPFGMAMSENDARRVGRAVLDSGVPLNRWPMRRNR
jgi:perosamine synthetase